MEFEKYDNYDKKEKIEINGVIESGKQFDLDIKLPEDNRNVVFGIVKNQYGDPIADAVVKLIEVTKDIHGDERKPVSHTLFDKTLNIIFYKWISIFSLFPLILRFIILKVLYNILCNTLSIIFL